MKRYYIAALILLVSWITLASGTNFYVDTSSSGTGDGSSWANARAFSSMSGLNIKASDTVYISGGSSSGSGKSYGTLTPSTAGTSSSRVTYKIGQESGYNGIATFSGLAEPVNNVVISGDAGDGKRHFKFSSRPWLGSSSGTNIRLSYIDYGQQSCGPHVGYPKGVEIDHIYLYKVPYSDCEAAIDMIYYEGVNLNVFGTNKIHDNVIYIPRGGWKSGLGDDGLSSMGGTTDIYNNVIAGYYTANPGTQHQDGIQTAWGNHFRIYNNTFINLANSAIALYYGSSGTSYYDYTYVYNNIVIGNDSSIAGSPMRGMDITSGWGSGEQTGDYNHVIIANNLIVDLDRSDWGSAGGINMYDNYYDYYSSVLANNLVLNDGGVNGEAGISISNNINLGTNSGGNFVKYTAYAGLKNDYHLTSESSLIGKGTNLNSHCTNAPTLCQDRDGNPRPTSGAWDIGPYQYVVLGPVNGACGTAKRTYIQGETFPGNYTLCSAGTPPGTTPSLGSTAGATVTWTCAGINGGTPASCNATRSSKLNGQCGPAAKAYSETETFPNGAYCSYGTAYPSSPANPAVGSSTSWTCAGSNGGTNVSCIASRASVLAITPGTPVTFSLASAGVYKLVGSVSAPNEGANSFYVDIDANPGSTDDSTGLPRVWDVIPITTGFQDRDVNWRGAGTDLSPQFVPKNWTLTAGSHTLYLNSRESGTQIQSVQLVKLSSTSNFHSADTDKNWTLSTGEVSIYNLCWKTPTCTPSPATTYVSNANLMWKSRADGAYHYAGGSCPLCWVSGA